MIEKILERLEERAIETLGIDKSRFAMDKGEYSSYCSLSLCDVKEIVQEVAKEYGNASSNDLAVVSALPSLYPLQKFEEEAIHKVVASAKDGGWIPTADRLPTWDDYAKRFWVTIRCKETGYCTTNKMHWYNLWEYENGKRVSDIFEVIAWKPYELPAPYQKGE